MHKSNVGADFNLPLFFYDVIIIIVSFILSYYTILFTGQGSFHIGNYLWILIIYIPLWTLTVYLFRIYNNTTFNYFDRMFKNLLFTTVFSGVVTMLLVNYIKEEMADKKVFLVFLILHFLLCLFHRYIYINLMQKHPHLKAKRVVVVGIPSLYEKFKYYLNKTSIEMNILDYIKINDEEGVNKHVDLMNIEDFKKYLSQNVIDEVIFTISNEYASFVEKHILVCEEKGVTVSVLLDLFPNQRARIGIRDVGPLPLITFHTVSLNIVQLFLKRCMDVVGAIVGIILTSVIWIVTAVAIKIDSPGPIFFKQDRVGLNGRIFKLYKFRSMYIDAEQRKKELLDKNQIANGLMFKVKNDPRITRVGKFIRKASIDELPQFINVLKGDMSLVGTRPPTLDEVDKYDNRHWRRISIKPGITGGWQVSGRSDIFEFDKVVELDTQYIDRWSIWLDIKIIIKTVLVVLKKKGAF